MAGGKGSANINGEAIILTTPDERYLELIRSTTNIYLSATEPPVVLAARCGIAVNSILTIEQGWETPSNIDRYQIGDHGRCKKTRVESTDKSIALLAAYIPSYFQRTGNQYGDSYALADHKSKAEQTSAAIQYMSNSRGSNEIEGVGILVCAGLPKPNYGSVMAEYSCFYAPEFNGAEFYQHRIAGEIVQLEGRLRADRYASRRFAIVYLTDDALPFEARAVRAGLVCPEAAGRGDRAWWGVCSAIVRLSRNGARITQKTIGEMLDLSQPAISQICAKYMGLADVIIALKNISEPYSDPIGAAYILAAETLSQVDQAAKDYLLPELEDPETTPEAIVDVLGWLTQSLGPEIVTRSMGFLTSAQRDRLKWALLCAT